MGNDLEMCDEDKPCILYAALTNVLRQKLVIPVCRRAGIQLKDIKQAAPNIRKIV
jgi:hypothetical protein